MVLGTALRWSDPATIAISVIMEIVDNPIMLVIPGAIDALAGVVVTATGATPSSGLAYLLSSGKFTRSLEWWPSG